MKINMENREARQLTGEDGNGKHYTFYGWPAKELLRGLKEEEQAEFISRDGQVVAVSAEEILNGPVFLAKEKNSFRLVILSDTNRRRWCKEIVEIKTGEA
ncbi:MAG: hypothetical protein ACI4EO_03320 [Blautia sp.]